MKSLKYSILLIAILIFSACAPKRPKPQQLAQPGQWVNGAPQMWTDNQPRRDNYNPSAPEPFSHESGQQDPEVLGPQ